MIPLAAFWAIAAWTSTSPLETDLAARSTSALKDTVLDKRRIAVAGRDVTFAADAFSEDGRRSAVAAVEAVPGVRLVNDETRLVPEASPFVWSAERDVVRVTLGGSAPLPASKSRLMEAARATLGGVEVADQMNLARGAPPRFDSAALLLLDQVGKLKDGKIGFHGHGARPGRDTPKNDQRNHAGPPFATPPEKSVHSMSRGSGNREKTNPCEAVKLEIARNSPLGGQPFDQLFLQRFPARLASPSHPNQPATP